MNWDDVRRIALALPDAEEGVSWGKPAFLIRNRPFVHPSRVNGVIHLPLPDEDARLLINARPDVYFLTSHYEGFGVLLRLDIVDENELSGALEDAYEHARSKGPLRPRKARPSPRRRGEQ